MSDGGCILDLCGGTGAWSKPYRDRWPEYQVTVVDPEGADDLAENGGLFKDTVSQFISDLIDEMNDVNAPHILRFRGVIAAPPCTEFAGSGARWWVDKDPQLLWDAIQLVRDCLWIIQRCKPDWWILENPVGRLAKCVPELGKWHTTYQPWEYGDPYTKKTCLWGNFTMPPKTPVEPTEGGKIWRMAPSPERAKLRSITPPGFAQAFFEANP